MFAILSRKGLIIENFRSCIFVVIKNSSRRSSPFQKSSSFMVIDHLWC